MVIMVLLACNESTEKATETRQPIAAAASQHNAGKQLFYNKCASCHMVNKELTGPALKDVRQRWPDTLLLYAFIKNSEAVINTNAYARELWLRYNQTPMPAHPDLTDNDIREILNYIDEASATAQ
jgi:cytochrome c551/c552